MLSLTYSFALSKQTFITFGFDVNFHGGCLNILFIDDLIDTLAHIIIGTIGHKRKIMYQYNYFHFFFFLQLLLACAVKTKFYTLMLRNIYTVSSTYGHSMGCLVYQIDKIIILICVYLSVRDRRQKCK